MRLNPGLSFITSFSECIASMTSPNSSAQTSPFSTSGQLNIDALLNESLVKWGGPLGTGVNLSFSFPWLNGKTAYWQTPDYSNTNEPTASSHFGFNAYQTGIARLALQAWANVANINFTETTETATNVGDLRFAFSSAVDQSGAWGWAGYPNNYWASGGDIWISTTIAQQSDWSVGTYNHEALMHEIGHALGLKHPGDYGNGGSGPYLPSSLDDTNYTIMSYNDSDDNFYPDFGTTGGVRDSSEFTVYHATPMVLDIAAIQYIYGANMGYRTGNDTYTFDGHTPFFETIWDAGGIDTIDVSAYTLGTVIDLRPGHYSSLYLPPSANSGGYTATYDGTNALGIAYGCIIENVIGSTSNDTIYENSASNTINGGDGTDTLVLAGRFSDYRIVMDAQNNLLLSHTQSSEVDTITSIEKFNFSDRSISYAQLLNDLNLVPDISGPTVSSFSPLDGATGVMLDQHIAIDFSEAIARGTGNIVFKSVQNNVVETFDAATSNRLSISGSTLTLTPTASFNYNTHYWVEFDLGCVLDLAGNKYAGTTTYDFTTADLRQAGKTITGTANADHLVGTTANDMLLGLGGNDDVSGGAGVDTFVLNVSTQDVITHTQNLLTGPGVINGFSSSMGTVTLHDVERVQLSDGLYAFDTQAPGNAAMEGGSVWQAQAIYQAAFGHQASTKELSQWTAEADRLGHMGQLGQAFIDFYANSIDSTALVSYLYAMLTHTEGSPQEIQSIVAQIGAGQTYQTQGDLLAWAARLSINTINLVGFSNSIVELDPSYF